MILLSDDAQDADCGISNVIERRYGLTERDASIKGSYLLAGSVALYPVVSHSIMTVTTSSSHMIHAGWLCRRSRQNPRLCHAIIHCIIMPYTLVLFLAFVTPTLYWDSHACHSILRRRPRVLAM